jgi:hypothetical protein
VNEVTVRIDPGLNLFGCLRENKSVRFEVGSYVVRRSAFM